MDGIVVIVMHLRQLSFNSCMFELTVRRRTLLEFSNVQAQAGAAGTGPDTGVGTVLAVPWEKWGPNKTHILENDSFLFGAGSVAGERCAMVLRTQITIRDYNPYRVGLALALVGGAGREVTLENGSVVKVVKEPSVHRGGEWFCEDIETRSLPYVETVAPYDRDWCDEIIMDEDNLVLVPCYVRWEVVQVNMHLLLDKLTD
jgi:hypothetical protein